MRISDWSSDVCSSDLQERLSGRCVGRRYPEALKGIVRLGTVKDIIKRRIVYHNPGAEFIYRCNPRIAAGEKALAGIGDRDFRTDKIVAPIEIDRKRVVTGMGV